MSTYFILRLRNGNFELIGPLPLPSLVEKIKQHEFSWMDFVYTPELPDGWSRLADLTELRGRTAEWPSREVLTNAEKQIKSGAVPKPAPVRQTAMAVEQDARVSSAITAAIKAGPWFLQFDGGEFGPFSPNELLRIVGERKMEGKLFAWCKGLPSWVPVESAQEIQEVMKNPAPFVAKFKQGMIEKGENVRAAPRCSLIATVRLASSNEIVGICMDISSGGLQLFVDAKCTLKSGDDCELEILPAIVAKVGSFRVMARVLWRTEEKIGFRFLKISEADKNTIDKYVQKTLKG